MDLDGWVGTARSGYEGVLGQYGDKRRKESGKLILENTMFDHEQIHMYTWERTEGKSMIDLFDQRIRSQVKDKRVFRGSYLGTDHYLVVARIRDRKQVGAATRGVQESNYHIRIPRD